MLAACCQTSLSAVCCFNKVAHCFRLLPCEYFEVPKGWPQQEDKTRKAFSGSWWWWKAMRWWWWGRWFWHDWSKNVWKHWGGIINQQWGGSFCKSTWDDRFWQRSLRTWPFRFDDSKGDTGIWRGTSDASPGNEFFFHRVQGLRTWQLLAGDTVSKPSAHCCDKSVWNYFLVPSWGLWRQTGALWSLPFPHVGWVQELSVCCITKWIVARTSRSLTVFIG